MPKFKGSIVALVTPMKGNGELDFPVLDALIDWHMEAGTDGILVLGTTGEAPTITSEERRLLIQQVVGRVAGRVPVIVGTGSYATGIAVKRTKEAAELGADGCLVATPYYNKPTQEGLYLHYQSIADASRIPLILYNVPSRTACDMLPKTVARLSVLPQIVGIKEASGDIARIQALREYGASGSFALYAGEDALAKETLLMGGYGVISVTANVAPHAMHALCAAALDGDAEKAEFWDSGLRALHSALFVQSNPIPVKWALAEMGKIAPVLRLPLTPLSSDYYDVVRTALQAIPTFSQEKQ